MAINMDPSSQQNLKNRHKFSNYNDRQSALDVDKKGPPSQSFYILSN